MLFHRCARPSKPVLYCIHCANRVVASIQLRIRAGWALSLPCPVATQPAPTSLRDFIWAVGKDIQPVTCFLNNFGIITTVVINASVICI